MKNLKHCITVIIMLVCTNAFAEQTGDLLNYLDNIELSEKQQHYFDADQNNNQYYEYDLVSVNVEQFDHNRISIRLYNHFFEFIKEDIQNNANLNRKLWIGKIPGTNDHAHFVINDDNVVGHIKIDGLIFNLRPLTGGIHTLGEVNIENVKQCETDDHNDRLDDFPVRKDIDPNSYSNMDERQIMTAQNINRRGTGECNIRVLIVYTSAIDAIYADILSEAINQMALANTGANNSNVNFQWEIAAVKEITYFEDTFSAFVHRNRLIDPADGFMDIAHTWRNLWSADQVSLLFAGGAGATIISLDPTKALSTTGSGNFNSLTFQHELAHNFTCTHDLINTIEPGTAPFAGWGEPSTGCFRTIMAYQQACGVGTCGRDNVFSDNSGTWNCNSINYAKGSANNRNTDILNTNDATVVDHRVVGNVVTYGSNYDWFNKEAVHFAANDEVGYTGAGSNQFEFHSGSQGSFRATTGVTLGEGFWAHSGSDFRAYRENCGPVISPQADEVIVQNKTETMINLEDTRVNLFPNPASDMVNIEFYLNLDGYVSLSVYDVEGKLIDRTVSEAFHNSGMHTLQINGGRLSAGNYMVALTIDDATINQKLTIIR
ncbi:MAG: T9SS type A sorting domain-containing protein [Chitinophagales bacterium]|nr:T9SS type A sorting domain-containing protein [Chitinophagales bacterium]